MAELEFAEFGEWTGNAAGDLGLLALPSKHTAEAGRLVAVGHQERLEQGLDGRRVHGEIGRGRQHGTLGVPKRVGDLEELLHELFEGLPAQFDAPRLMGERLVRTTRAVDALFRRELCERVVQQLEVVEALHNIMIFATDSVVRIAVGRDGAGGGADALENTGGSVRQLIPTAQTKLVQRNSRRRRRALSETSVSIVAGSCVMQQSRRWCSTYTARLHSTSAAWVGNGYLRA